MTDETTDTSPLFAAFKAASLAQGAQAAEAVIRKHGATSRHCRSVPEKNQAAAIRELNALAGQTGRAPSSLDPAAIYSKWNGSKSADS